MEADIKAMPLDTGTKLIDVIVTTHNRIELTIRCINALYAHTRTPFHLIAVDDSTDGLTTRYFADLKKKYKNISFVHSNKPYKSGNQILNIGVAHSQTDFVASMSNSVRVEPDWEIVALHMMKQDPAIGIIGFKALFPDHTIESAGIQMGTPATAYTPTDMGRGQQSHRLSNTYEVDSVQWAFCLLRKAAVPVLDEDVYNGFVGWDDIDDTLMLKKGCPDPAKPDQHWKVLYCGLGACYHEPRATRGNNSQEAAIKNAQNREIFYKRWGYWDDFIKHFPDAKEFKPDFPKEKVMV